jgi:4-diphosphocytidyl-2-C-methyl-D-erythritol kinase
MKSISINAYAKINLGLDVIRKRSDGYHDVCMIMQSVELHDDLIIKTCEKPGINIRTNSIYVPNDKRNLVYKAADLFMETNSINSGLNITLQKKIPVSAGLAGGSSDAAATLKGLNTLFQLGMSDSELMKLGIKIGADVPYCIMLGTALSEGIGDLLTPLPPMPDCYILLVKPDISVSTKYVYENLKLTDAIIHPNITAMQEALKVSDLDALTRRMDNILQSVTVRIHPIIDEIKGKMLELGAMTAIMSGSGPTVFGIFHDRMMAEKAQAYFMNNPKHAKQVFLTKPYYP